MARYSVLEVCRQVGVCRDTLLDWEQQQKIPQAQRDRNGWRFWEDEDIETIRAFASKVTLPVESRAKPARKAGRP